MLKSQYPFKPVLRSKSPKYSKRSSHKNNKPTNNSRASDQGKVKPDFNGMLFHNTDKENVSPRFFVGSDNNKQMKTLGADPKADYTFADQIPGTEPKFMGLKMDMIADQSTKETVGGFLDSKDGYQPTLGHLMHKLNCMR